MRDLLSAIFRSLCYPLVTIPWLYFPGMVLVRLSRVLRKLYYSPSSGVEMRIVRCAGTAKMSVDRNSYMGGSIYWSGFHHLQELLYLENRLKGDMVFVDIGANQGEFALFAAGKLKSGTVIAFEPVTKNRALLESNVKLNEFSNIRVFPYGLSDKSGSFPIYTSFDAGTFHGQHEGLSTLYQYGTRNDVEEVISLSVFEESFSLAEQRIDFIKIDVEGAELYALRGMKAFLEKYKPDILIEINEETFNAAGYKSKDITTFLREFGYVAYKIRRGKLTKISDENFSIWGNYVFSVLT